MARTALLILLLALAAAIASAAPLSARQLDERHRGPPGGGNGTRPDFNGTRPDGPGPRGSPFTAPVPRFLSTVSAGCVAAANSTSAVDAACKPASTNGTEDRNSTLGRDAACSDACSSAVDSYWTAVEAACGTEPLVTVTPRNDTQPAFNLTASELADEAHLELVFGCTKDLSGAYCPQGGRGGPGGRGGRGPRMFRRHRGGPGGRGPGGDGQGQPPAFNATVCEECSAAALTAIAPLEAANPSQTFFGRAFGGASSWAEVKTEISGRCAEIADKVASATARPVRTRSARPAEATEAV
ncbi:hypothetical protein DFJ74DRAFT_669495 [Hyaloraphidium curvatum]|nr:hypothetical protein DFJ74DRAFT_669495 [Hyaloraphidium curvatum]